MTTMYMYDIETGEFLGSRPAQVVGEQELTVCANATTVEPPQAMEKQAAVWNGQSWDIVEDHRQKMDATGTKTGGTPYWLPDDDWQSPARYTEKLGTLPADALLEAPQRIITLEEAKSTKEQEINSGYDAALTASLTMPSPSSYPSAVEIALALDDFKLEDPEGWEFVRSTHTERRDALLSQLTAAQSVADVQSITVSYAV